MLSRYMLSRYPCRLAALAGIALLSISAGCQRQTPALDAEQLAALRGKFMLPSEPDGVEGVLDVQEAIKSPRDVVLLGQIGGVTNPWTAGKATFVMADPVTVMEVQETGDEHACTDPSCKFCQRKKNQKMKEGIAIVRFVDPKGEVVPVDARELFEIADKEMVVVRGRAEVDGLGCLVVLADGLYVRR